MTDSHDPQQTVPPDPTPDPSQTVDERPPDPLEVALGVAFGPDSGLPYTLDSGLLVGLERRLRAAEAGPHQPATLPTPRTFEPAVADRYELFGEIGRGGMGAVLRGRDPSLGRDLAVKVLLEKNQAYPEVVQRFVEEAQIGGQLQHPGVVPVYELGRFGDGRPYFTMKLVKGRTLAALLAERADPAQDRPRFLGIFLQVCQTLAYAHSKGVIHRDLKPANVMVGAFGEVQVMDWGLAKVLAPGGPAGAEASSPSGGETVIRTSRTDSGGSESEAGYAIGTPSYMAPEQALGQIELVDQRSDVFGLGAVLCEMLTNQPPYEGEQGAAVLRRAARADLRDAFAHLDASGADAELLELAKRCLAPEPTDRPRDAGEVAGILGAYLEGIEQRLRAAQIERATAEARAEEAKGRAVLERRARRLTGWLAASALLLVLGGGGGAWWWQQQQAQADQRRRDTDEAVRLAMAEARRLNRQARAARLDEMGRYYQEARAAGWRAAELARAGEASEAVREEAQDLRKELGAELDAAEKDRRLLAQLLDVRSPRETPAYRKGPSGSVASLPEAGADEQFAQAFCDWGLDVNTTPTEVASARLGARPPAVVAEVVAALDEWASERRRQRRPRTERRRLTDLALALGVPSPGSELRAILTRERLPQEWALGELSRTLLPWSAVTGQVPGVDRNRLRELARQTDVEREPVLGLLTLARALEVAGDGGRAEGLLRAATRVRPGEVVLLHALGGLLERQRPPRWDEAVTCYTAARAVRPELGVALAKALAEAGRPDEGLAVCQELLRQQPENPAFHFQHGYILYRQGRYRDTEAAFRRAIALRPDDFRAHSNLGAVLARQGRHKEAEGACRRAIALRLDYPEVHVNLGVALMEQRKYKEAEAAYRLAIVLRPGFAEAHFNLGAVLMEQRKYKEAETACRRATELLPEDADAEDNLGMTLGRQGRHAEAEAAFRRAITLKGDHAQAHYNLGFALAGQGRHKEAEAAYRRAIALKDDYAQAYVNLGVSLRKLGRHGEAEAAYRRAIALRDNYAEAHNNLGIALAAQHKYQEAEAAYRRALAHRPDYPEAHNNLGNLLARQGKYQEAEPAFRRAVALKDDYAQAHFSLGTVLAKLGKSKEAEAHFRRAVALTDDFAEAHFNLGIILEEQGRHREAEAVFHHVIALRDDFPKAHYNLGVALRGQGKNKEAEAAFRRAIDRTPDFAEAYFNLGVVLLRQGKFAGARATFRRVLGMALPGQARQQVEGQLRLCQQLLALDEKLPAILRGDVKPAGVAEQLGLAVLCLEYKKRYAAAARFYTDAFAAEPKLAEDLDQQHRCNAACAAALAAAGKGEDAGKLDDKERLRLRKQALDWLRADLAAYTRLAENANVRQAVRQRLTHWLKDADLAGVRDEKELASLPEAKRKEWQKLWADVTALLKKLSEQPREVSPEGGRP